MKKIKVYGSRGYVGRSVVDLFKDHYRVIEDDAPAGVVSNEDGDFAIVCVPTPMSVDGKASISIVEEIVAKAKEALILIKSTIPPGTVEYLKKKYNKRICFSPEYIGEGKYVVHWWRNHPHPTDMKKHSFQIFGGAKQDTKECVDYFVRVLGPSVLFAQTDSMTAEFVKYTENIWGAMKVTWANEMFECAEKLGLDWHEIRELWALDGRVEKMHTAIFKDKRGWAGKCYPKDLMAFIKTIQGKGYEPEVLKEIVRSNARFSKDEEMKQLPDKL
jgi:nucleotide sugar dehydrogenase